MNSCKVNNIDDFITKIINICDESSQLDINEGSNYIQDQILELIKSAKNSNESDLQLKLLKDALNMFYDSEGDDYGEYFNDMTDKSQIFLLFDTKYDTTLANNTVSSTFEETVKAKKQLRQKNFIGSKFKGAPNAKLYFQRSVNNDLVETFLVKRNSTTPKYFTSQEEMNLNVLEYKQELLDRIFSYFENNQMHKNKVSGKPKKMFKNGKYTGVLEELKPIFDAWLSPENLAQSHGKSLDKYYQEYRDNTDSKKELSQQAKRFLDAYNAWIMLQNFDTIIQDVFNQIITVNNFDFNGHVTNLTKYEIRGRASNMWNNWTTSDDIADMSEVISDVTQKLIETSKMYKWGSNEAYPDRYVSFHDFNYVIGLIKNIAFDYRNDNIILNQGLENVSIYTKKILADILAWNRANDNFQRNAEGQSNGIVKPVTLKQLVARINENPQRYLHAIFDILCNTNVLKHDNFKDLKIYDKNLIWSFYKEMFGGDGNSRSLYNLHTLTQSDNVYQIITQVAASTFPEKYLQYYEKLDGSISTRLLEDYAQESIENTIFQNIQQTGNALTDEQYKKYNITYIPRRDSNYLDKVNISIPIDEKLKFTIDITSDIVTIPRYTIDECNKIWNNQQVQNFFKDILGIDFGNDPDFKNAYMEIVQTTDKAIKDLGDIIGTMIFNSIVNNQFVPKHPAALVNEAGLKTFINNQYGTTKGVDYAKNINLATGMISVLPTSKKKTLLTNLTLAKCINNNLLSQAQSKTGEGTSLANYTLSRMRNFYQNQLEIQGKSKRSAIKNLSFVVNSNGLFEGILSRRELKTLSTNQQSTKFSDKQSFQLSFVSDFISGFIPNPDGGYIKNGKVSFLPTVNSDKSQIDGLLVNLYAETRIPNGKGGYKKYIELTDEEIEQEMVSEFKNMYNNIVFNINSELNKVKTAIEYYNTKLIQEGKAPLYVNPQQDVLTNYFNILATNKNNKANNLPTLPVPLFEANQALLNIINDAFKNNENFGKKSKERITNGLHEILTEYNKTHSRNPIMLSSQVHYIFDNDGLLTCNKTLKSMWGRFGQDMTPQVKQEIIDLYKNEPDYLNYLQRNGLTDPTNIHSFFKYKEHLTVENLIKMNFSIPLRGSSDIVRDNSQEIQFLRGETQFTEQQLSDPNYVHLIQLNNEMKNWIGKDGMMILAKGIVNGEYIDIKTVEQLHNATNLKIHPMLSKLNRLDYLCSQQYTISTVGSHYVHKGGAKEGQILVEEAKRWLASNKRNVAATSTVHLFQNKQLDGVPSTYNMAIIEDVYFDLYNIMGDLYLEGHAPLDGGMFVNGYMTYLENNSLAGESAGLDKKQFGTFYSELYGAGGIVKTAGFAATNARMRRQRAWYNLQKNMTNRKWVQEYPGPDGADIPAVIDITYSDYLQQQIDYTKAIKGQKIMYKRPAYDNPQELAAYRLERIESLGNNNYRIYEVEINQYGNEVDGEIHSRDVIIDSSWSLYENVFGGHLSLEIGHDNKLTWSENSMKLLAYATQVIAFRKNNSHVTDEKIKNYFKNLKNGLDQDDVWQPLKAADIHYTPNIGAIKSLQFNVNPDGEAVLNGETTLNFMTMRLAQLGIQLDKEHHADASDVSMPTQIIQACANRSYTSEYAKEIYDALSVLTRQVTQPFLDGIKDIITGEDPTKLVEEVTNLILDNLLHQSSEDNSANAILKELLDKAERGDVLTFAKDIKGKIPWSDPTINAKLFSSLSTTLTNLAVKMKFAGTLSVICPTGKIEVIHGDRMMNSFVQIFDKSGVTRTKATGILLEEYQKSVREGNEVDSDGRNMLIFDLNRDLINQSGENISEKRNQRFKLSKISEVKTQHHYIIEFADGSKEEITINTPEDYYRVKNLTLLGKRTSTPILWAHPAIGKTYSVENGGFSDKLIDWDVEFNRKRDLWIAQQSKTLLNSDDFKRARNEYLINWDNHPEYIDFVKNEWERVKQKANKENKILVASPHMLLQLFPQDFTKVITMFEGDFVTRNVARNANNRENSIKWKKGIDQTISDYISNSSENYQKVVTVQDNEYLENLLLNGNLNNELTQLASNESFENGNIAVAKVYENVEKGRELGAYNVRFSNNNIDDDFGINDEQRFQIFDLDSVNLMFNLNRLNIDKKIKGYKLFQELTPEEQQQVLNKIFNSTAFDKDRIQNRMISAYSSLPQFDGNFINNILNSEYKDKLLDIIKLLHINTKPRAYRKMQNDLFKLSDNYKGDDRQIYVNGELINPVNIQIDAYELIMPQIYKTQFGLQEYDDLQEILRDKEFFLKRGLSRFECKLQHTDYDYELKNFNGEHYYVLDKNKGIPEHLKSKISTHFYETRKGKTYRTDHNGQALYELSSENDSICTIGGVDIIITDNPLFYVQNLNYNTLKTSPLRVTEESYQKLIDTLSQSKRQNSINFLNAIKNPDGNYFDLNTFKEFNQQIDELNYENVKLQSATSQTFKTITQLCRILIQNGKELHTSFSESLNIVAGRIPAQSQQSFMTQRVIGFDNSGLNTAMVSTFQLFLQGSDLDIDAVTLLGYEFDKNGKFVKWSPYFKCDSKENLIESKNIPLPTGKISEINASEDAPDNFFERYNKYFGTLFTLIPLTNGGYRTDRNGNFELALNANTPEGLKLLAEFLREFNEYGINIKAPVIKDLIRVPNDKFFNLSPINIDGKEIERFSNLQEKLQVPPSQFYSIAKQLLKFANDHNNYINIVDEYLKDKMAKNYIVHYIYKVSGAPCNQTEAMMGLDQTTKAVKNEADNSFMATAANSYAPGSAETKHKSVGEGQVGKSCVGIGAVGIKANSTTQFYISQLWNFGTKEDKEKILFKRPVVIAGKTYESFANMYTTAKFNEEERAYFEKALNILENLESPDQITENVAVNIASLLSIAVDNAKDLALAKINSGPRMMGMYAYGLTLGIPIQTLVKIINSEEGRVITELTEGSYFSNDSSSFKVLDVFGKLKGNIGRDLTKYEYVAKNADNKSIKILTDLRFGNKQFYIRNSNDMLFAAMYPEYQNWYNQHKNYLPKTKKGQTPKLATTFSQMVSQIISINLNPEYNAFITEDPDKRDIFNLIYDRSKNRLNEYVKKLSGISNDSYLNYIASIYQLKDYISNINEKSRIFYNPTRHGADLQVLAEGAEEMRILGSILSINKGLKSSMSETETFIDTIENLIYNRKEILGQPPLEKDRIDFIKFMLDEEYQNQKIEEYEKVKHSVNILHLISKVSHFNEYLKASVIPPAFFLSSSIKYRTLHKYRHNINADADSKDVISLFKLFETENSSEKEQILKGLENLIQNRLMMNWLASKQYKFKIPKGFKYFNKDKSFDFDLNEELSINLSTEEGLATFKKYMEEEIIPNLINNPQYSNNAFVRNLTKIEYNKTANHDTVYIYSLHGDLMSKKGKQAELNAEMFAAFQNLSSIAFQPESGIPSLSDAFYLYALYCYNGKKGQKSLMNLFDIETSRSNLAKSFNEYVAIMDSEGNMKFNTEELITWCAPKITQYSKAKYGYTSGRNTFGISLRQRIDKNVVLTDEQIDQMEQAQNEGFDDGEGRPMSIIENYGLYRTQYSITQYDRIARNNFLVPIPVSVSTEMIQMPINIFDSEVELRVGLTQDKITHIRFSKELDSLLNEKISNKIITKFNSSEEIRQYLIDELKSVHIPYKTSLNTDSKQEMNLKILQTMIEQLINC